MPLFTSILSSAYWSVLDSTNAGAIEVTLHQLPLTKAKEAAEKENLSFVLVFLTGLAFSLVAAPIIEFLVRERSLGFKHQQLVSGVSLVAYWSSAWLWDVALYQIPAWGTVLIFDYYSNDLEPFTKTFDDTVYRGAEVGYDDSWDATRLILVLVSSPGQGGSGRDGVTV